MTESFPSMPPAPPGAPFPSFGGGADVHLLDRLGVLHKYQRLIISIVVLVLLAGVVQTYTTTPLYRSTAKIQVDNQTGVVADYRNNPDLAYTDPEEYRQTQFRILRSRELARRVINELGLASDPTFTRAQPASGGLLGAARTARGQVFEGVKSWFKTTASEAPVEKRAESPDESALIDRFLGGIVIDPVRNTRLVDVSYISANPEFAARAANAIVKQYILQNLEIRQDEQRRAIDFLAKELTAQEQKILDAENRLNEFRQRQGSVQLNEGQTVVVSQLNDLQARLMTAEADRAQKENLYAQLKELGLRAVDQADVPVISNNGSIQVLRTEIRRLQSERTQLLQKYGEKHPDVVTIDARLQEARDNLTKEVQKVIDGVGKDYDLARRQEAIYRARFNDKQREAQDLNSRSIGVSSLESQVKINRDIYSELKKRQQELQISSNSTENNVRMVDSAEVPKGAFTPLVQRNLLIALAIGLALGVAVAVSLDYIDDTIKTPEEITNRLRIPFLGLVPAIRGERTPLLSQAVPHDFGEAFRALRTALVFTSGATGTRVIAVTSAQPLEGKTTTACNLAIALALGGARVLLIDADMRRPGVHRTLGIGNDVGVSHLLTGQARVREVIQRTDEPNLLVITAGRTPPNPSELLASPRMKGLIDNLSTGPLDWVIIDTPPVLAVTDAVILTPLMSGVVFVLGAEMTRRRLAERAIQMLTASKPQVFGAVLNRVNFERNKYYYSRYYGYQYKSYYGQAASA